MPAAEGITPRLGGEAWVEATRMLRARPLLPGVFIGVMTPMLWLESAFGEDDGTLGLLAGDLMPAVVELFLVATLMIAVQRAVILGESRPPPPWRSVRAHGAFMGWLLLFGILDDGMAALMQRAGMTGWGLLAHAGLFAAAVYLAMRLALVLPMIAVTGLDGMMLWGAWGLSRGHVAMMVVTVAVTGAPLLGGAVLLLLFGLPMPAPLVAALLQAAGLAVVLPVLASLIALFFLACSRLQEMPAPHGP